MCCGCMAIGCGCMAIGSWPKRPCFLAETSLKTGTFRPKSMAETDLGRNVPLPGAAMPLLTLHLSNAFFREI